MWWMIRWTVSIQLSSHLCHVFDNRQIDNVVSSSSTEPCILGTCQWCHQTTRRDCSTTPPSTHSTSLHTLSTANIQSFHTVPLLTVPGRDWTTIDRRSFAVAGPYLWNSLPAALRRLEMTLHTFKRQLKAYLFHIWCASEQKEHSPPPCADVVFSWFWRRI